MVLGQGRLVIKGIDVAGRSRAIDDEHLPGGPGEMTPARGVGLVRIDVWPHRHLATESRGVVVFGRDQLRQSQAPQREAGLPHEVPPAKQLAAMVGEVFSLAHESKIAFSWAVRRLTRSGCEEAMFLVSSGSRS